MKRMGIKSKLSLFICCLCLTGCSAAAIPQPTKAELLAEVNAEHQAVQWENVDPEPYIRKDKDAWDTTYFTNEMEPFDAEQVLTRQQAEEDVDYLFRAFRGGYSLYGYFGGDEVFGAAQEAILQELDGRDTLTGQELTDILTDHLTFIEDGHFCINLSFPAPTKIPFFFRETAFLKTETGYQTTDGRAVQSVDGYADLDGLFKRSISQQGQLVYYPVLLQDSVFRYFYDSMEQEQTCGETLTVRYTDGTSEELTAEPYRPFYKDLPEGQKTALRQDGAIPVFQFNNFHYKEELLEGAQALRAAPVSMLDLRSNTGGEETLLHEWINAYSGRTVPSNGLRVDVFQDIAYLRQRGQKGAGRQVSNENTLIILTGKFSASSSEGLLDTACNLENVLIIGENSAGGMVGNGNYVRLPNSKSSVTMSAGFVYLTSEENDRFEELRGYYPDIWVPACEAEELAAKLMEQLQ